MLVLYWRERLRDGNEEGARITATKEEAVLLANKLLGGFAGCIMEFKLFELGKELPLKKETVVEKQPDKIERKFVL